MPFFLYNLALFLSLPVLFGIVGWRLATRPEYRDAVAERFGRVARSPEGKKVLWVHAVSVGEVISAVPLMDALRSKFPGAHLVVSCGTPTGRSMAMERLSGTADRVVYLAYDLPPLVGDAVAHIRPDLFLMVETEIWPNLLNALSHRETPVLLVNGRISRRSFPLYMRIRPLIRKALEMVAAFLMQTPRDAGFLRRIGAPVEG